MFVTTVTHTYIYDVIYNIKIYDLMGRRKNFVLGKYINIEIYRYTNIIMDGK